MPLFLPRPTLADLGGQSLDSDLTDIATLATTPFGRAFLTLADSSGLTIQSGTWTPAYTLTGGATITYGTVEGKWFRLGKLCFFLGGIVTNSVTAPSGSVRLNLPFAAVSTGPSYGCYFFVINNWATTFTELSGAIVGSQLFLYVNTTAVTEVKASDMRTGALNNQNRLRFTGFYEVF
jgi:hypothetical protein